MQAKLKGPKVLCENCHKHITCLSFCPFLFCQPTVAFLLSVIYFIQNAIYILHFAICYDSIGVQMATLCFSYQIKVFNTLIFIQKVS